MPLSKTRWNAILVNWDLYLLLIPVVLYFALFHYWPMYGVQIAFKDFIAVKGIDGSAWVGLKHFTRFFHSFYFGRLIRNTLGVSLYQLVVGFPVPILLALLLNEVRQNRLRKFVQTVTYAPHFLSSIVLVGMMLAFLSPKNGILNQLIVLFGGEPISFLTDPLWFKTLYVLSDIWQNAGWASIIYIAALAGIDPQLYEAAKIDGAGKWQIMKSISLRGILATIVIMFILQAGQVMSVGFEKVFLMQNNLNLESSEVISTYVYKNGLVGAQYSYATAIGLFNSLINFTMLLVFNGLSKKIGETSLW